MPWRIGSDLLQRGSLMAVFIANFVLSLGLGVWLFQAKWIPSSIHCALALTFVFHGLLCALTGRWVSGWNQRVTGWPARQLGLKTAIYSGLIYGLVIKVLGKIS